MWTPLSNFTAIHWDDPIEIAIFLAGTSFSIISLVANRVNVPFLHREGGLMTYSKFATNVEFGISISSKWGMALLYWPSVLLGTYFLHQSGSSMNNILHDPRALAATLMIFHFGKRTIECLFLHKYSGKMPLSSSLFITSVYLFVSFGVCYCSAKQHSDSFSEAGHVRMRYIGLGFFLMGQMGNFYHHLLLASLRKPGDKAYKVPSGGLFEYVAAPHYLFEIISWIGVTLVCQHVLLTLAVLGMAIYLSDRAVSQSKWNRENLKGKYPAHRKHLVPFLF